MKNKNFANIIECLINLEDSNNLDRDNIDLSSKFNSKLIMKSYSYLKLF